MKKEDDKQLQGRDVQLLILVNNLGEFFSYLENLVDAQPMTTS